METYEKMKAEWTANPCSGCGGQKREVGLVRFRRGYNGPEWACNCRHWAVRVYKDGAAFSTGSVPIGESLMLAGKLD